MPFDPAQPADGSSLSSAVMRSQLTSLKALIDAVIASLEAQVDAVTTLPPGQPATATASVSGSTVHFTFGLPQGQPGADGQEGPTGPEGPPGPPFAQAVVDGVTTLPAGDPASVSVSFDGTDVHFSFAIPQGQSGPPGEVSQGQLDAAIATTPVNPLPVAALSLSADFSYNQGQLQQIADKVDELLSVLKRL